jgi:hypothetical protein
MSTLPPLVFAILLRRVRRAAGLSQEALARQQASVWMQSVRWSVDSDAPLPGHAGVAGRGPPVLGGGACSGNMPRAGSGRPAMMPWRPHRTRPDLRHCRGARGKETEQPSGNRGSARQPAVVRRLLPAPATRLIGHEQEVPAIYTPRIANPFYTLSTETSCQANGSGHHFIT